MSNIRIRARIALLSTEDGGRTMAICGSYRPNHNFGAADNRSMDIAFIELAEGETLQPGAIIQREITFWSRPGLRDALAIGRDWRIQEGAKLVGVGTVLDILEETA